jgi:hypothetical protein
MSKIIKRIFAKEPHPAHLPYQPAPPEEAKKVSEDETSYTETEIVTDAIDGTDLEFGVINTVEVKGSDAKDSQKTINRTLGNGRRVNKIDDVYGECPFCKAEAKKMLKKGRVTEMEAQAKALYHGESASECEKCGAMTCQKHTRPVKMPDDEITQLCKKCQKKHKRKLFFKNILHFITSPFMEDGIL